MSKHLLMFCYYWEISLFAFCKPCIVRTPKHYDRNKSFEHVQNYLISCGGKYELSSMATDNGVFLVTLNE